MKLSTKSTYGLRAMLNIALKEDRKAVSITDIARREGISVSYLEQLLNKLRHEGFIKSMRGPKGGYMLSKGVGDITVFDIVKALEGGIYPVHCVGDSASNGKNCIKNKGCVPKMVWHKLADAISECLESITLKDLCAESKKLK
jgi:Rrf2 family protein